MSVSRQVSRVSDVISIGQQVSLMCIGQDVRGNIKLSLKATLPQPGLQTSVVAGCSVASTVDPPKVRAPVDDVPNEQVKQDLVIEDSQVGKNENSEVFSSLSLPTILIRSAAECDEEEKSAGLNVNSKSISKTSSSSKSDCKSKTVSSQNNELDSPFSVSGLLSSRNPKKSKSLPSKEKELNSNFVNKDEDENGPISAKKLKLGMKVSAKVHQIRVHGLVLDLGGGIRGMYRFEVCHKHYLYDLHAAFELCFQLSIGFDCCLNTFILAFLNKTRFLFLPQFMQCLFFHDYSHSGPPTCGNTI